MNHSTALQCPICLESYNLIENLPRTLGQCGHTVCAKCLSNVVDNCDRRCPLDKVKFSGKLNDLDDFPINFTVRQLIEEASPYEACKIHNNDMEFLCITDQCKVCARCALFGGHRDHNLKHISEYKPEIDSKRKELEGILSSIIEYHKGSSNLLEENSKTLQKVIEDRFEEWIFRLEIRKQELMFDLLSFFKKQKEKLDAACGNDSYIKAGFESQIVQFKEFTKSKDIIGLLDQDTSGLVQKHNSELLNNLSQDLKLKLKKVSGLFSESLVPERELSINMSSTPSVFLEDHKILYYGHDAYNPFTNADKNIATRSIIVTCPMTFTVSDDYLQIKTTSKAKEQKIKLDEWRDIKRVRLVIDRFINRDEDIRIFDMIWASIRQIDCLKVITDCRHINIPEDKLISLFSTIFSRLEDVKEIELSFQDSRISNDLILLFLKKSLQKGIGLKNMCINISDTKFDDSSLRILTKDVLPLTKNLDSFELDLSLTKIDQQGLIVMFKNIPDVKSLKLGFGFMGITDEGLIAFIDNVLCSRTRLEALEFDVQGTKITNDGVLQLLTNMPLLKNLSLNFEDTQITDIGLIDFVDNKLPGMKGLETIKIELESTQVSQKLRKKIAKFNKRRDEANDEEELEDGQNEMGSEHDEGEHSDDEHLGPNNVIDTISSDDEDFF